MQDLWIHQHGPYVVVGTMPEPVSSAAQEFGARVRARRNELQLSQEAAAVRCGVHWTFLGQVERGQRNISLHNILKIAHGLEIDAGELLRGLQEIPI